MRSTASGGDGWFLWTGLTGFYRIFLFVFDRISLIAIEVKRAAKIRNKEFRGLKAFARDYPMASLYMFYGGDRRMFVDNITLIPIKEALEELPDICQN